MARCPPLPALSLLGCLLLPAAARAAAPEGARPRLEVRAGTTPRLDGVLSPGEWDDAAEVRLAVAPDGEVEVRAKHDGAFLHVAFRGLRQGGEVRSPGVLVAAEGAAAEGGVRGFLASPRDCEGQGRPEGWECAGEGWSATGLSPAAPGVVELRLSFARLQLVTGRPRTLALAFLVTDGQARRHLWPAGATPERPASWAELSAPDAWSDLGTDAAPLRGRVETLTLHSRALGETVTVPVYLPPGHTPRGRWTVLYTVMAGVFFAQPGVQLPRRLERLPEEERLQAVVVGIPGASAEGWHHPDTAAATALLAHVAGELLPEVERRYAPHARREDRALLGFSSGANVVLDWAVRRPGLFGRVALVSPGWMDRDGVSGGIGRVFLPEALAHVRAAPRGRLPQVWVAWGDGTLEWERRSRANGRQVVEALRARGAQVVEAAPVEGEHGLHLIPRMLPAVLRFLSGRS